MGRGRFDDWVSVAMPATIGEGKDRAQAISSEGVRRVQQIAPGHEGVAENNTVFCQDKTHGMGVWMEEVPAY